MKFLGQIFRKKPVALEQMKQGIPSPVSDLGPLQMTDRSQPTWMRFLSFVFSFAGGLCIVTLAVTTIFFQSLVVGRGNTYGVGAILLFSVIPLAGLFILDLCRSWSMSGFRWEHDQIKGGSNAIVGGHMFVGLTILNPWIGLSIPIVSMIGIICMYLASRIGRDTPQWDFSPNEAVAIFAGRDTTGLSLAQQPAAKSRTIDAFFHLSVWSSLIVTCAMASWLVARDVLNETAVIATMLLTYWSVDAVCGYFRDRFMRADVADETTTMVQENPISESLSEATKNVGLVVEGLCVENTDGKPLLRNVGFTATLGTILGIHGVGAAGKSVLINAIINPWGLHNAAISGAVEFNGMSLWERQSVNSAVPVVMVSDRIDMLQGTGTDNLTCFQGKGFLKRGEKTLESFVNSMDVVQRIMTCDDVCDLSTTEQKALSLARAFLIGPSLYLLDRPEDHANDQVIQNLAEKIKQEKRSGRTFILVTENRVLLDLCDEVLMLQDGRMTDHGPAKAIRDRLTSGWKRFKCARNLESEDMLQSWLRTQFRRRGDEGNRRKVCTAAAELLAVSSMVDNLDANEQLTFDFKNFPGHCIVKLTDTGQLLSSGQIQIAQRAAKAETAAVANPLARLMTESASFEQDMIDGKRVLSVKLETYDPRVAPQVANQMTKAAT